MPSYYDDNFGFYEIHDEDDVEFYEEVQRRSKWTRCKGCDRKVKLMHGYGYCDSCATKRERGWDI